MSEPDDPSDFASGASQSKSIKRSFIVAPSLECSASETAGDSAAVSVKKRFSMPGDSFPSSDGHSSVSQQPRIPKTIISFKVPSNITVKNGSDSVVYATDAVKKRKKKPFKGLSYSFNKKKKKKLAAASVSRPSSACSSSSRRSFIACASEGDDEENDCSAGDDPCHTHLTTALSDCDRAASHDSGDSRASDSDRQGALTSKPQVAPAKAGPKINKARKSVPSVVLRKSFIPADRVSLDSNSSSATTATTMSGAADSWDTMSTDTVASSVKMRRTGVCSSDGGGVAVTGADSNEGSAAGDGGVAASCSGEAAPPEGTLAARMLDPLATAELSTSTRCCCTERCVPSAQPPCLHSDEKEQPGSGADESSEQAEDGRDQQGLLFCQAIDSIDGRLIGCCNTVEGGRQPASSGASYRMSRASVCTPFQLLCQLHRVRRRWHHSCPGCGVFCTQGVFVRCTAEAPRHTHLFHHKCAQQMAGAAAGSKQPLPDHKLGPRCLHCQCDSRERLSTVQLTIRTGRTPTFYHHQRAMVGQRKSARIALSALSSTGDGSSGARSPEPPLSAAHHLPVNWRQLDPRQLQLANGAVLSTAQLPSGTPERKQLQLALEAAMQCDKSGGGGSGSTRDQLRAVSSGDCVKLVQLLMTGWSANHVFAECGSRSALHLAAQYGHVTAAHVLVTGGAELNALDEQLATPLWLAAQLGKHGVLRYLIGAGASTDCRSVDGMSPLHVAAQTGSVTGCRLLLTLSATPVHHVINRLDDGGWTPLVWAAENGHLAVVRLLLQFGANARLSDEEQNTPLHWAVYAGSETVARLLLSCAGVAQCCVNAANVQGDTPLHVAARRGHLACVLLLLQHGARMFLRNGSGQLPLECAEAAALAAAGAVPEEAGGDRQSAAGCVARDSGVCSALRLHARLQQLAQKVSAGTRHERVLSNDISDGKERVPIQAVAWEEEVGVGGGGKGGGREGVALSRDYTYLTNNCETRQLNIDRTISSLQSCHCRDNCASSTSSPTDPDSSARAADGCGCCHMSVSCWYGADGRLVSHFNYTEPPMIFECNRACTCSPVGCLNRCVQHGLTQRLQVFGAGSCGWGVRPLQPVARGTFVCEYVGELITDSEADHRSDDAYLFDLENRDSGDTFCIDARRYGNVARFINHSCQPNLVPIKVFVDHHDMRFPRIALFACRDISVGEQLGFDYGEKFWMIKYKSFTCQCAAEKCRYSSVTIHHTLLEYQRKHAALDTHTQ